MEENKGKECQILEDILKRYICPQLNRHGGDAVLVKVRDRVAYIRLTGHCSGCPAAKYTLESLVREEIGKHTDLIDDVLLQEEVSQELYDMAKEILAGKKRRVP